LKKNGWNGVLEKLLENWLDSAGERTYQPSFVQMLAAQGYCVLHSTRHCSLEYGKDVLAIAPDGVPCAFQLKGHPGGSLGLREFRSDVQQQIIQMISQPIVYPRIPEGIAHRSYLVSNGYFEEEVHRAVDDLNRGPYLSKLALIGRGQLLSWANDLGASLWPSEMDNIRELLEVFLLNGQDILPLPRLASILEEIFTLRPADVPLKYPQFEKAIASAALLTCVATHNFERENNHFALASGWCFFVVSAIASNRRTNYEISEKCKTSLKLAEQKVKDSLVALWGEMQERKELIEGNALAEPEIYRWRYTLLCGLMSVLWFFPERTSEDTERKRAIAEWLDRRHDYLYLWGEAAIPCLIALQFFRRSICSRQNYDQELVEIFQAVVSLNQAGSEHALADPYYSFEEVGRVLYGLNPTDASSALKEDTFAGSSYSAELLLHLMVRYNLKKACQDMWPNFNRLCHKRFVPSEAWLYGVYKCNKGVEETRQYPPQYTWEKLVEEANIDKCEYIPEHLAALPHLLLLWVIIAPHRLTTEVVKILDGELRNQFQQCG
jgi:hypothetical protein